MTKVYKRENAALFDIPIEALEDKLANLPWMDTVFGKCERLTSKDGNGKAITTPNWFVQGKDYMRVMPDDRVLKNMAFFTLDEPMRLLDSGRYSTGFSLIVWGDMRRIDGERNLEVVKAQILKAVKLPNPAIGKVVISEVYEKSESVWRGYTVDEMQSQFMMQPYFALRLSGTLYMDAVCNY